MKTNNVKKIRKQIGMTQCEFAKAIGVSQTSVSKYEAFEQQVLPETAKKIVEVAHRRGFEITLNDVYALDHIKVSDKKVVDFEQRSGKGRRSAGDRREGFDRRENIPCEQ